MEKKDEYWNKTILKRKNTETKHFSKQYKHFRAGKNNRTNNRTTTNKQTQTYKQTQIMASPQSLMGLVSQLQNFEQKLTDILLEISVKMTSLTEAKVFILVETRDGRKFAGNRLLCEDYRNSQVGLIYL